MSLTDELRKLIPAPCRDRPFVCDGQPERCDVIVIGENPAINLNADWWRFWDDATGFDLAEFEREYASARQTSGKSRVSSTRPRLERLRKKGLRCLETNTWRNERLEGHGRGVSNNDLLAVFFEYLPGLKAVIAHGKIARTFLETVTLPAPVQPYYLPHFRQVSYTTIDELADKIATST
jgi:hypothetical protein